jgi:Family of unknown function (DUF6186)
MTARDWSFLVWTLLGSLVLAWLLLTFISNGRFQTLGAAVTRLEANRVARILLVVGWMWLGWHAFAR